MNGSDTLANCVYNSNCKVDSSNEHVFFDSFLSTLLDPVNCMFTYIKFDQIN